MRAMVYRVTTATSGSCYVCAQGLYTLGRK
jgi:hypothetical protein